MRYSLALAALTAGSVAMAGLSNELPDGQIQEQVSAPASVVEATALSTVGKIITSCAPTVENCPASKTPTAVAVSSVTPRPSPEEAGSTGSPSATSLVGPPVIATPSPSTPVVPVPGQAGSTGSPSVPIPVVPIGTGTPGSPNVPIPVVPVPSGASACPTCPSCTATTVYATVTVTPTPAAGGSTGAPSNGTTGSSGSPSNGSSGSSGSPGTGSSGSPGSGSPSNGGSGSASPSGKLPPAPGSPVSVPAGGAGGAAAPSGSASGTVGT